MRKITKRQAFSRYKKGLEFILVPSKMSPSSVFAITVGADSIRCRKEEYIGTFYHTKDGCTIKETFERSIASFYYYNCDPETGMRVSYWVNEND